MRKGTSMLWLLLPVAACSGAGAVSPASPPEMERAVMTSVVSAVTPPAGLLPVVWSREDVGAEVGCGFTHRGDQSRSLELAVTDVHREAAGTARPTLAWTAPPFTLHLDGYEYRAHVAREGARDAAWVDTGSPIPAVELPASRSGPEYAFEVVARYRFPLRNGHVYYWYGPAAATQHARSATTACGPSYGQPDTTLAYE